MVNMFELSSKQIRYLAISETISKSCLSILISSFFLFISFSKIFIVFVEEIESFVL